MPKSKPHYRKATVRDALAVAANLRSEDKREIEGLGLTPLVLLFSVATSDHSVAIINQDNKIAGVAGIAPDPREGVGQVWLICTPEIKRCPREFIKQAKVWLEIAGANYTMLWNQMDARNDLHHKLVKMLGFKFLKLTYPPPYNLPYIEIARLCV